jgi:hypothetical protein
MYKTIRFKIEGVSPLLCHNGRLANPLDEAAKAIRAVSGKRKKTDADHAELARLEFLGGLYLNDDGRPVFPGENIEAAMVAGAKKQKLGQQAKAGIICDGLWPIEYDGPKNPDAMWAEGKRFADVRGVKLNGRSTVMRCRPIFRKWALAFDVQYLPTLLDESEVTETLRTVGRIVGLGDFKPKFGRFEIVA